VSTYVLLTGAKANIGDHLIVSRAIQIALFKGTSAYPTLSEEMNLPTIPYLAQVSNVPVGLSDHSLSIAVPATAITLGACIVEKHFTLSRDIPSPDSTFSLEPQEFKEMVNAIRVAEKALDEVHYEVGEKESKSRVFWRSLFVVKDMKAGEVFTEDNVCSIRLQYDLFPYRIASGCPARAIRYKRNVNAE